MVAKQKKITWKDVKVRMTKMKIAGSSSMAEFTPDDIMRHLDEIKHMLDKRKSHKRSQRSPRKN